MTAPVTSVSTPPYCGACGKDILGPHAREDLNADLICDSCGADLLAFGWAPYVPPPVTLLEPDTPLALDVSVTFTATVGADSTDLRHRADGGAWTVVTGVTSVHVISPAGTTGQTIDVELRSVVNGLAGSWGTTGTTTLA